MHFMAAVVVFLLIMFSVNSPPSHAVPFSTRSRWIVDESTGKRVKLACVNWEGHMEPMLPEGLHKQPLDEIGGRISSMGFNCVRLTYAAHMITRHSELTVTQNFQNLSLTGALEGISKYNPKLSGLTLLEAQRAVIEALGSHGVMVLLDCHVSQPMWCCGDDDGNGFFGDQYFDPQDWLEALSIVSLTYKDTPTVMAMSLRNEFRGTRQNEGVWYQYVEEGAKSIHSGNPNVLIVVSGLGYDIDFGFLRNKPLTLNIGEKLVYEVHRYAFSEGQGPQWLNRSVNHLCQETTQSIEGKSGFLMKGKDAAPLFVTEFGVDQTGSNQADNLFLSCYLSWLAENDLDWALWAGHGSYYLRDGKQDSEENYGLWDSTWTNLRNPSFHSKLQLIQRTLQDPFSEPEKHALLYHPLSGSCGVAYEGQVFARDCWKTSQWMYNGEGNRITLKGSNQCLTANGDGLPVVLTNDCTGEKSAWKLTPNSMHQLAVKDEKGNDLCLDWDPNYSKVVLTKKCIVAKEDDPDEIRLQNPQSQWFILVESNAK